MVVAAAAAAAAAATAKRRNPKAPLRVGARQIIIVKEAKEAKEEEAGEDQVEDVPAGIIGQIILATRGAPRGSQVSTRVLDLISCGM